MNSYLLNRQLGSIRPQTFANAQNDRLLRSLHSSNDAFASQEGARTATAHAAGVGSICVDRFEGRYLLSAGAESSVAIWDLDQDVAGGNQKTYRPIDLVARTSVTASLGITHISFYPFDSLAFFTSGYDHTLKLFSSETLQTSAKFDLGSTVYSHACSTAGTHLLVACATQHPTVRLVDLRSGASAHALAGHSGSVLTVAWHPQNENLLASGATDGAVRLWDVRRSANSLGVLDLNDSVGTPGYDRASTNVMRRERGIAHVGATNGIAWTDSGHFLVSLGTDEKMRVWDMTTGANTLANFGPSLKNARNHTLLPLLAPAHLVDHGAGLIFFPNPREILSFDLYSGDPVQRLRPIETSTERSAQESKVTCNLKSHTTSLAWRAHHVQMYSGHMDGTIRAWTPQTWEDELADEEEDELNGKAEDVASKKRKREELEQIVRDLTTKKVTFS